jgi:hypothetical protein
VISRFFIDRPILSAVLSVVITLTGGFAVLSLMIAQLHADGLPGRSVAVGPGPTRPDPSGPTNPTD